MYLCVYLTFTSFNTQCLSVTCISENASGYFIFPFWNFPLFLVYHVDLNQSRDRTRSWTTEVFMLSEKKLSYYWQVFKLLCTSKVEFSTIILFFYLSVPIWDMYHWKGDKRVWFVWINNTSNLLGLGFFLILGSSHASEITVGDVSRSAYLPYFNVGSWKYPRENRMKAGAKSNR